MRKSFVLLAVVALFLVTIAPAALAAPSNVGEKVEVEHITPNGNTVLISVSENAVPAHLAHGDSLVGQCFAGTSAAGSTLC